MKPAKILAFALSFLLIFSLLPYCISGPQTWGPSYVITLDPSELQTLAPDHSTRVPELAAAGANDFAFELSAELLRSAGDGNFICSPYSVWLPLAALAGVTDVAYRPTLQAALRVSCLNSKDLSYAASSVLYSLTNQREHLDRPSHNPLKTVHAIFTDDSTILCQDFSQVFLNFYLGSLIQLNLDSPQAVSAVNQWAAEQSEGRLSRLVESFPAGTKAALSCGLSFSDRWTQEFNPAKTAPGLFHSPHGDVPAQFMRREDDHLLYYEDDKLQAVTLPFSSGDGLCILLPKDMEASALLSSLTNAYFDSLQQSLQKSQGVLSLPHFSVDCGPMSLKPALSALGIPLFREEAAPLTTLLEGEETWLADVVHNAILTVNEQGTTAAEVLRPPHECVPPSAVRSFTMTCDRPFVFVLYGQLDEGGSQVLFTGVINAP